MVLSGTASRPSSLPRPADGEADGIVQRVFGGLLRSDVTCRACGHTSTAFDPFLDLSLDLPPAPALPQVQGT